MKTTTFIFMLVAGLLLMLTSTVDASSDVQLPFIGTEESDANLPAGPVALNPQVLVADDIIVLGDLFMNAGKKAGKAVAYSPQPGRKTIYDAKWLYRVARYFGLDWKPASSRERIVITRDSVTVGYRDILDAIMMALSDEGAPDDLLAELSNRNMQLYLPANIFPEIAVENLVYDKRSQRFSAVIIAPASSPDAQRHRVTGKLYQMVDVPVLNRNILAGELITQDDIEWQTMRMEKISRDTITTFDGIVGMSPRRGLRSGFSIRTTEIQSPVLVKKKSLVTIVLEHEFMTLTAKGRAMQSGSMGDVISITNSQSNQIVDAEIVGPGRAVVRTLSLVAMN